MKNLFWSACMVLCLSVALLTGCGDSSESGYPVEITVFSVGKADAILVQVDDSVMLIDAGEEDDEELLLSELEKRDITHLDMLQITHFDKDHVGSAAAIVNHLEIDRILYPDYEGTRDEYFDFMEALEGHSGVEVVAQSTSFTLGSAEFTVYPADDPETLMSEDEEYDNEMSLVTRMAYGDNVFLFGADAEKDRIKQMLDTDTDWSCDWMKLPHHGKYGKQLAKFVEESSPAYCVMTVSEDDPADDEMIECLENLNVEYYDTLNGNVVTYSDGKTIKVE